MDMDIRTRVPPSAVATFFQGTESFEIHKRFSLRNMEK